MIIVIRNILREIKMEVTRSIKRSITIVFTKSKIKLIALKAIVQKTLVIYIITNHKNPEIMIKD